MRAATWLVVLWSCIAVACHRKPAVVTIPEQAPEPVEIPASSPGRWIVDSDGIGYSVEDWDSLPESEQNANHRCYERTQDGEAKEVGCPAKLHFDFTMDSLRQLRSPAPVKPAP